MTGPRISVFISHPMDAPRGFPYRSGDSRFWSVSWLLALICFEIRLPEDAVGSQQADEETPNLEMAFRVLGR